MEEDSSSTLVIFLRHSLNAAAPYLMFRRALVLFMYLYFIFLMFLAVMKADCMQGPRLCNRIILASKCHAIRDAQIAEKELIKKELDEEERR